MRVIAVEEHMATEAFLRVAHRLDVLPGDESEVALIRPSPVRPLPTPAELGRPCTRWSFHKRGDSRYPLRQGAHIRSFIGARWGRSQLADVAP